MRMRSSSLETLLGLPRRKPRRVEFRQTGETNTQPFFGVFFFKFRVTTPRFLVGKYGLCFFFLLYRSISAQKHETEIFWVFRFLPQTFSTWRLFFSHIICLAFAKKRVAWLNPQKNSIQSFCRLKVGHLIGPSGANIKVWASRWRWIQ